ncbi:MBOAT family protein [Maribius pontilimi]|uniref:Probable alginate O-acetylase AlgI n=1 Tax=Palleronia pontilimi TaxID=1964209 RepID=A0A934IIT3_9RHOB|nr:MBOAT family O-acyltransferase [Palleronia pontilimi]MBJ3763708.1 MBOAT family protein [Palleronia pontilimi]
MLFTSPGFLVFLPAAALVFWLLPRGVRLWWMLLVSVLYYASFGLSNLAYLAAVAGIVLVAGRTLSRPAAGPRKAVLWGGVGGVLTLLFALRYYDPLVAGTGLPTHGLAAPAGFSFYAFMAIALLVDRYRAAANPSAGIAADVTYLAWFPKILAGPIQRIDPFLRELGKRPLPRASFLVLGAQLFVWGLVKKVVVADNLAPFVDRTYAIPDYAVPMELLIATYFFAFQIYCDFSGYTDMARGASLAFGLKLPENFRRPYFAGSIGDFWGKRWHITLSDWFRDYVYHPILGPRRTPARMYAGIMVVFVLSGIWHAGLGYGIGWGFVAWGALNGLLLWVERALRGPRKAVAARIGNGFGGMVYRALAALLVFHLILVTWIFFRAADLGDGITVLTRIWAALPDLPALLARYPFTPEHRFLAALILALLTIELVCERPAWVTRLRTAPRPLRWSAWYACLFALILLGRWQGQSFVYMQF